MPIRRFARLALLALVSPFGAGCFFFGSESGAGSGQPESPVSATAEQAWPNAPELPAMKPADIVSACAVFAACTSDAATPENQKLIMVDVCDSIMAFSAERAIPISGLVNDQERAEFAVACFLKNSADCSAAAACMTGRDTSIDCEEDGCRATEAFQVTCDGSVATLRSGTKVVTRDCARAFAECRTDSPTGCTDRHFTTCPPGGRADTCDGNVRLGCDGTDSISYHDCERMSGICGTAADGSQDCLYGPADAECSANPPLGASCSGQMLSACLNGRRIAVSSPTLCPG